MWIDLIIMLQLWLHSSAAKLSKGLEKHCTCGFFHGSYYKLSVCSLYNIVFSVYMYMDKVHLY